jgi:phosphorylcholine metabolism protein LicD
MPPCCRKHLLHIFAVMDDLFAQDGVRWWLDYGSLLGAVRNPLLGIPAGIVPHDKDGDIGIYGEDWERVVGLRPKFRRLGLGVIMRGEREGTGLFRGGYSMKIRRSAANHTNVDIFPWWPDEEGVMHRRAYIAVDRYKGREFPGEWLEPLQRIEWEDLWLPVPAEAERLAAHRYGDGWMRPVAHNHDGIPR